MLTYLNSYFSVQIIGTDQIIRSNNLESKLTDIGLKFEISPGIVPNEIDFQDGLLHSAILSNLICQRKIQIGEVGCALAHRNAMTNFLNSDRKFGIIFEDDAEIIADFDLEILIKLLDTNLPIIIALGWIPGFAIAKNLQTNLNNEPIELITSPTCAFAYGINRQAAKLMVSVHERIIDLADWPIYSLNKVNFYATNVPWVTANHDPQFSIIGKRSNPISRNPFSTFISRIRLAISILMLMTLSITNRYSFTTKQVIHQLLIRGSLQRYGVKQVLENSPSNGIAPFPLKFQSILKLLKIT